MEAEILNIEYNKVQLLLKALNKHKKKIDAANALKISERKLFRMISDYKILYTGKVYSTQLKLTEKTIEEKSFAWC